jgi:hypothetical protein
MRRQTQCMRTGRTTSLSIFPYGKKGMGIGQVFVFITAAITFAFILIFGYSAVSDFLEKGERVEFYQFKNAIEADVKKIFSEYGAVRHQTFRVPAQHEQICFVDLDHEPGEVQLQALCEKDSIACDVWDTAHSVDVLDADPGYAAADQNVFLTPPGPAGIKVFKLEIDPDGFLCIDIDAGSFEIRLEGKGSKTKISTAQI